MRKLSKIFHNNIGDTMPNIHSNITFGLVNIPVIMNPIIKNNDTSFNQLHSKCLTRVKYIKYCPHCKKNLKENDIIKGYQFEKDNYLVFDKDELDKLKPENDKEIEVVSFVKESDIPIEYFEKSYFLETENKSKSYRLFYEALKKTKLVALAKTIISTKFYYCILRLAKEGIIMTTLYFDEEVKIPDKDINGTVSEKELNLAIKLIDSMRGKFEPSKYIDEYQDNIKNAIEDKLDGKKIKISKKKNKTQVKDLLDALEKSLKENK